MAGVDGLVSDVASSVAAVKRDAGTNSKSAGLAIDSMVTRAIEKGQFVKETVAGRSLFVGGCVDGAAWIRVKQAGSISQLVGSDNVCECLCAACSDTSACTVCCLPASLLPAQSKCLLQLASLRLRPRLML